MKAPAGIGDDRPGRARALGAVAGVLAAAVAMGAAQFASGLGVPQSSPVSRSARPPSTSPRPSQRIRHLPFGPDDKTALLGGILVVVPCARRWSGCSRRAASPSACAGWMFAAIGLAAALTRPTATVG